MKVEVFLNIQEYLNLSQQLFVGFFPRLVGFSSSRVVLECNEFDYFNMASYTNAGFMLITCGTQQYLS
mgnify:CR=1 FL=1